MNVHETVTRIFLHTRAATLPASLVLMTDGLTVTDDSGTPAVYVPNVLGSAVLELNFATMTDAFRYALTPLDEFVD